MGGGPALGGVDPLLGPALDPGLGPDLGLGPAGQVVGVGAVWLSGLRWVVWVVVF